MGSLIALQRTTPSQVEFHHALTSAWDALVGDTYPCNAMIAAIMFGQFAFETGWGKSCWNWNLGNHRTGALKPPAAKGWEGDYVELRSADEVINGKRVIVGGYFRAYGLREDDDGLINGALGHLEFLLNMRIYRPAWNVLLATAMLPVSKHTVIIAAGELVDALKHAGYFTGELPPYRRGVQSISRDYLDLPFVQKTSPDEVPVTGTQVLRPDDYRFGIPGPDWTLNRTNALDVIKEMVYPEEYSDNDRAHLATVLSCRYDCEEAA